MINHAVTSVALSPDTRWVATSAAEAFESKLWDARSGRWVRDFPGMRTARVLFSPDNRWLVIATAQEFLFHRVGSWESGLRWLRDFSGYEPGAIAFTRSGQTVAIAHSSQEIKLRDVESGRELATLAAPVPESLRTLCVASDGGWLAAGTTSGVIQLWDLERIRLRLREMGLDWDPPARPSRPDDRPPVEVAVDLGEFSDPEMSSLILALSPFDAEAYYRRGLAYARRGQTHEGFNDFRQALALEPNHVEALYQRGLIRASQGNAKEAIADFSRAIALKPDHAEAYTCAGRCSLCPARSGSGGQRLREGRRIAPDWPEFPNNAAWLMATHPEPSRRDPERAVVLARKAVDLEPDQAMYWNTLGVAHYRARHWKEAIESLTRSMQLSDSQAESYDTFFLAMAHWQLGDKKEACQWFDRAVQWMKNNPPNDEELGRFRAEAAELLQVADRVPSKTKKPPG